MAPQLGRRVNLGNLIPSRSILSLIHSGDLNVIAFLTRHQHCSWGNVSHLEKRCNDDAVLAGSEIRSRFEVAPQLAVLIVTSADRTKTTIRLSNEPMRD